MLTREAFDAFARSRLSRLAGSAARFAERFGRARDGVSVVEFALLAPVLAIMLGGAIEFSGAITASNRSTFVADALAEMTSRVDHTITAKEMENFVIGAALMDPDILKYSQKANVDITKAFKVTISSVQFDKKILSCLLDCKYDAKVVFSYTSNGTARACGTLSPASASTTSMAMLPADVFGPGTLVVVDVETFYMPVMPIRLSSTMSFKRSSYFRPRYVPRVNYQTNCPGY